MKTVEAKASPIWIWETGRQETVVGKLVPFEGHKKERDGARPHRAHSAEILIFTGVRYERESATTAPSKPPASSGGKRKRV
jgi:hypothetical protein